MAIDDDGATTVVGHLRDGDAALARAEDALARDPFMLWLRPLPIVGRQVEAAAAMVRATRAVTARHVTVDEVLRQVIAARDSGTGAERLAAMARLTVSARAGIDELLTGFDQADATIATVPSDGLLGPIASARQVLDDRLAQARPLVAGGRSALDVVPAVMGIGGQSRDLVLALDNAEVRPIGGLIGAFATPTFQRWRPRRLHVPGIQWWTGAIRPRTWSRQSR